MVEIRPFGGGKTEQVMLVVRNIKVSNILCKNLHGSLILMQADLGPWKRVNCLRNLGLRDSAIWQQPAIFPARSLVIWRPCCEMVFVFLYFSYKIQSARTSAICRMERLLHIYCFLVLSADSALSTSTSDSKLDEILLLVLRS